MRKKMIRFCILLSFLCVITLSLAHLHALGYRVNRSASLPGLVYQITPIGEFSDIKRGDCVLIDLTLFSNPVIEQGVRRGYVNKFEPMMKRIGAVPGDSIQLKENRLFINGDAVEMRVASFDSYGGELSAWLTPLILSSDCYWLISDPVRGFDSRYFGPLNRRVFTHKAVPIF